MPISYNALVVDETPDGRYQRAIRECTTADLPDHEVLIEVYYSALNYKDALSATGNKGVTQQFPHTPGIDAAGVIAESRDKRFTPGDEVIVTSYDLGQNTPGGLGQYISVPADWIVPLPAGLTLRESMMFGTAGFTAAYGVDKLLQNHINPASGEILVTGATGGVGSLAVALLAQNGFSVIAATGKAQQESYLKKLGAAKIIDRDAVYSNSDKPLLSSQWTGAIDTVGGAMLDAVLRQTAHNGCVACCGNILGGKLTTSIYPFILRGVSLAGIDSGRCLMPKRKAIWHRLATNWKPTVLDIICSECSLEALSAEIDRILKGGQRGKILVKLQQLS